MTAGFSLGQACFQRCAEEKTFSLSVSDSAGADELADGCRRAEGSAGAT